MTPDLLEFLKLAPIGFAIGAFGTLVGAGGGSILVPVLLLLKPHATPASLTSISLAVVFFNAYSGTIAYMRMGRIDYYAGTLFTLAGVPGAVLGVILVHHLPRFLFDPVFGALLLLIGGFLVYSPLGAVRSKHEGEVMTHLRQRMGAVGSAYIAVFSSLLGIGGGIIHVPFLIRVLKMPAHTATATSHFVLTFMALTATLTHFYFGELGDEIIPTTFLAVGVMMGAPVGAALSSRVGGSVIVRLLASSLCLVGLRLILK